ncbi:MAG: bifunctional glutamate N-acetyltransferase/amino-acid acetyltransferase ArgJ [Armatimonadota bacterium]|nr:bifunctional glutamate N-acetyltransferase/amino-acid acetyltransferase ArgJ [Armatimonadota bacterium]MDR7451250.1 bifunctional glutamate N-acetyltransferase/amino-acid acetyltransferase ArgJ [Armatimonadota bacterium]MDR7466847.1 bifunctional glutamate N-acetyltransferase/amino-acid acetyltransferase ArgJ [Armatimonadota bacterium]MDR7492680.1 bifunctional glutamate N-acetyltransferase/amino-acid acetyltransferase ArgJ [Armatimonadota bacterium]MDR7499609.1 bifunctional glutamate N-acetylt
MATILDGQQLARIDGGVTAPRGFRAAGIHCGIKAGRKDLALIVSETLASAAGMFTTNAVKAAPVLVSQEKIQSGVAQAVIVNSGNANACTGPRGEADAREMTRLTAEALGIAEEFVLVASTGIIGVPLPMDAIRSGIPRLASALSADGRDAAEAILTTDAFVKTSAVQLRLGERVVTIGGMAKGAGMIHPRMATMLAFLTTDAALSPPLLRQALRQAVDRSFNVISVDGDTSTNDSVFLLANGQAGGAPLTADDAAFDRFTEALTVVAADLARLIVKDGEGATKLITVTVRGARSPADARRVLSAVMTSPLVKTAIYGGEPNWGRILAAAGRSGAALIPERVEMAIAGIPVVSGGQGLPGALAPAAEAMAQPEYEIVLDLHLGSGEATGWTCDLNERYVKINAGYMT